MKGVRSDRAFSALLFVILMRAKRAEDLLFLPQAAHGIGTQATYATAVGRSWSGFSRIVPLGAVKATSSRIRVRTTKGTATLLNAPVRPQPLANPATLCSIATMTRQIGYATAGLLRAIAQGYRYGLDIMEVTGLPSGTVYPTLTRLESRGFVAGQWESQAIADREKRPRRRYYKLTAAGRAALTESTRMYGALAEEGVLRLKPAEGDA